MNEYELLYVVSPRLTAEEVDAAVERIQGQVESSGGEILMTDNWGRRRLAYPIKHHFEGTYVLKHVRLAADRIAEFERALQIDEDVLRHLLTSGIIPDYQGPPEQDLVEVRRPAPLAPRRDAPPPEGEAQPDAAATEGTPAEGAPAEAVPAPATAEGAADAPAPQAAENDAPAPQAAENDAPAPEAAADDAPAPQATEEQATEEPATASAE